MVHREIITWVDDGYVIAFGLVLLSIYSAALTFTAGLLTVESHRVSWRPQLLRE